MNEDWNFDSIPDPDKPTLQLAEGGQSGLCLLLANDKPGLMVIYNQGNEVGRLDISTGSFKFEGKMDESAATLFLLLKQLIDKYLGEQNCLKATEKF